MSFCDFAENIDDAIDGGCAYDYEEVSKQDAPQLLWLSDIPLFASIKAMKPGGHSYLTDDDNDSELMNTCGSSRVAYRDGPGVPYHDDSAMNSDDDDDEWADTDVVTEEPKRGSDGNVIKVLEDTPDWYEKYSSFLCQKNPDVILTTLNEMFKCDDRITFGIPEEYYQIRGSVYLQEKPMQFHINIFRDSKDEYLVEFQRHAGCMLDFQALYRQCLAHLNTIDNFLVVKIKAMSCGTFNFTTKTALVVIQEVDHEEESKTPVATVATVADAAACFPVAFDISKVEEYKKDVMEAIAECEKRFVSQLVAVRNEALCNLLLASEKMKTVVFPRPDCVFSVLSVATRNLSSEKNGLNKEMARCIAMICSNLCSAKDCEKDGTVTEEELKVLTYTRLGTSEMLVPTLLTFWEKERSTKCLPRDSETNNQIIHLLCVLYRGGISQYTNLTQDQLKTMVVQIEKRLTVSTQAPAYVRMHASLASALYVLKAAVKESV